MICILLVLICLIGLGVIAYEKDLETKSIKASTPVVETPAPVVAPIPDTTSTEAPK